MAESLMPFLNRVIEINHGSNAIYYIMPLEETYSIKLIQPLVKHGMSDSVSLIINLCHIMIVVDTSYLCLLNKQAARE
jgi:hypothetical protein